MNLPKLSERELLAQISERIESLEGAVGAHRATIAALMRVIPRQHMGAFQKAANAARPEILTMLSIPDGQPQDLARQARVVAAADREFRQLREVLEMIA